MDSGKKPFRKKTTLSGAIYRSLEEAGRSLTITEIVQRVSNIYDLGRKDPAKKIRSALAYNSYVERVGRGTYDLVERLLKGARFRYCPTELEVRHGALHIKNEMLFIFCFDFLSRRKAFEEIKFTVLDRKDKLVPVYPFSLSVEVPRNFFLHQFQNVAPWYKKTGFKPGDDLIITVLDAKKNIFRWERIPHDRRDEKKIIQLNKKLADLACAAVRRINVKETCYFDLMKKMTALFNYHQETPPDELSRVLVTDKRLVEFESGKVVLREQYERRCDTILKKKRISMFFEETQADQKAGWFYDEERRQIEQEFHCWLQEKGEEDFEIHLLHMIALEDYFMGYEGKPARYMTGDDLKFFMYSFFPRKVVSRKPSILPWSIELYFNFLLETFGLKHFNDLAEVFLDRKRFEYRLETYNALDPTSPKWEEKFARWCEELEKWMPEWFASKE